METYDQAGMTPCARENRCEERDYAGNAQLCPRAFCETDSGYIRRAVTGMPRTYVDLHGLLARSEQAEERVSGSREAPMPLAADVEAFMREIVHVTLTWEERVRAVARLSDYPDGHRRDSVALDHACRVTLGRNLDALLSLEPSSFWRPVTRKRVDEIIEERGGDGATALGSAMHWWRLQPVGYDVAGDAWEKITLDGTGAGLEFLNLAGRARGMLGLSRQRRRITEVRCDNRDCNGKTLVQYEAHDGGWEPRVRCTACPNTYIGASYDLLMSRVYRVQLDELAKRRDAGQIRVSLKR
jgi:hypothetical protein